MKNSKVRLMKRKSFIVKFAIITTIIIVIVLAYNFPESMINIIQLQARSGQEYDISQSVEMIELKGESYISDSQLHSDEMTRAAAIVDAIRLYGHYELQKTGDAKMSTDTSYTDYQWGNSLYLKNQLAERAC